ncbi:MAG: FUSC family protein [Betaproteobacteria bacterium]
MTTAWYRDLFKIDAGREPFAVTLRMALAVGIPLIGFLLAGHAIAGVAGGATALFVTLADTGSTHATRAGTMTMAWLVIVIGGTIGDKFGDTMYAAEAIVLLAALIAGWVSGAHPAIATVARFGALAVVAGVGMQITDAHVYYALVLGGVSALGSAFLVWKSFGIPVDRNPMDWHTAMHRALAGTDAGPRFALCYAAAAALALLAASKLGVSNGYWATLTAMMVMRREGVVSFGLIVQYAIGTLIGIPIADLLYHAFQQPLAVAILATAAAAFARVGLSLNPALGFAAVTVFLLLVVELASPGAAAGSHVLWARLYDVGMGCAIALIATLVASIHRRNAEPLAASRDQV